MTIRSVLALGSNVGDRYRTLTTAVAELADHPQVRLHAMSPVAQSKAVGGPEQGDFLNMVVEVDTELEPGELLQHCQAVEARLGRVRGVRWGPRTIDVDIITYGMEHRNDADLIIPHPRAHLRAFVLQPWAWMDSGAMLNGYPVAELAAAAADAPDLKRYEGAP